MSVHELSESHDLDSAVEAFEAAIASGVPCAPVDFAPQPSHPAYAEIVVELVRVDLERGWRTGVPRTVEDYVLDFPDIFAEQDRRSQLAYEEFRVRKMHGQPVDPADYSRRLGIDVSNWPVRERPETAYERPDSSFRSLLRKAGDAGHDAELVERLTAAFPEFDIVEELGRGAFACVFLARQRDLAHRCVVIKISSDTSNEPERLACLQHSGIVPVYSVHRSSSWQAMCMPFLGRLTLADAIQKLNSHDRLPSSGTELASWLRGAAKGTPTEPRFADESPSMPEGFGTDLADDSYPRSVCFVILQLAEALQHAHRRNLLHRDVKPANILIAADGHPMLLDFNLSSEVQSPGAAQSLVGGTLPYLAPEHLQSLISAGDVSAAADVYSLGVVMYELLTGRRPFPSRDGADNASLEQMRLDRLTPPADVRAIN
ncbi:MAG: serine/threonine-protein kinase, partial [Planctomycetaceae bacterium]